MRERERATRRETASRIRAVVPRAGHGLRRIDLHLASARSRKTRTTALASATRKIVTVVQPPPDRPEGAGELGLEPTGLGTVRAGV
jgi:hypothetical protein